ncbi:putative NAD(P)/FAD-binding protein YdhS [Streptosporangium album]|uniref:Putative NAD(P)/FAD-binding protein YdhS n=1 Tax=Streptosporangium album TaxID=47479 RepID=A0A7W7S2A1_9ACTN|nr:hypothetical protein [Streptosporangium album]MBB4941651.1 putative NAD(P)/FAD-binding protein YdhS [Streptosporangium album]
MTQLHDCAPVPAGGRAVDPGSGPHAVADLAVVATGGRPVSPGAGTALPGHGIAGGAR